MEYDGEKHARLIAAAPDMYEALVKTLEWFKKLEDWSGVGDPDLKAITDAIDKATGESNDAPGA